MQSNLTFFIFLFFILISSFFPLLLRFQKIFYNPNLKSNVDSINNQSAFSKITIVYMSPNGSTRKCANLIAEQLKEKGEVSLIDLSTIGFNEIESKISGTTLLGVGSPTYHLNMLDPVKEFLKRIPNINPKEGQDRYAFCFSTYGHVNSGKTLINMAKILHKKHYNILSALKLQAKHFYQNSIKFPEKEDEEMIIKFSETIENRLNNPIEWKILSKMLNYQYWKAKIIYPFIQMFGNGFRVPKMKFNKDLCTNCGLCEKNCPTHVIDSYELPLKKKGCIYCFNCVMVCPTGAIYSDIDKIEKVLKFNAKVLHEKSIRAII